MSAVDTTAGVLAQAFEMADVSTLVEHPENPRSGDVEAIAESVSANGFFGALVVQRSTHHVLVGNHRLRAAKEQGIDAVPVLFVDVDDDRARRILIADNRTAELAHWNAKQLADLLSELAVTPAGLAGSGFSLADLVKMVGHDDDDDVPDEPATPRTQPGDLWLLGEHRLLCGDSTNADDVARLFDGATARLLCTDPPYLVDYNAQNHPQSYHSTAIKNSKIWPAYKDPECRVEFYIDFLRAALDHLAVDAPIYQWYSDNRTALMTEAWATVGLHWHQTLYWVKANAVLVRKQFMQASEACAYGWRKQPRVQRRAPDGTRNVWDLNRQGLADAKHPTAKPVDLFADPYTWHLRAGEIGYEPFSGSGTAIVAALRTGRRCYAVEVQPTFVDVACTRWQHLTGELPRLQSTGEAVDFDTPAET